MGSLRVKVIAKPPAGWVAAGLKVGDEGTLLEYRRDHSACGEFQLPNSAGPTDIWLDAQYIQVYQRTAADHRPKPR